MADVTCLRRREADDDPQLPEQTLTLDSIPYWSHADFDFDFYPSDPEFPPANSPLRPHNTPRGGGLSHQFESTISLRGDDNFSDPGSIPSTDLLDRENQVNFVMDLFQQRVEQSQVMGHSDLVSEVLDNSNFGIIEGHSDAGVDALGMDFGLGLGFGVERDSLHGDDNSGFVVENYGSGGGGGGDGDDFLFGRRVSGSESVGTPSTASRIRPFDNCVRLVEFGSDSDEEDDGTLCVRAHSEDEYNVHDENDDVAGFPLCWDSLQVEQYGENTEDFEWEEVDGRVDEREVLSMLTGEDDASVSVSVSPINGLEEEAAMRAGGVENLGWEVLLNANNLDTNPDLDHDAEPYFGDHDDYIYTAEYEMMFGQFADSENPLVGRPPASVSVVQNLPSVIVSKQDIEKDGALCAVCKDEFNVEEQAKQLPCSHFYHGECIVPWLGIRNTCPVCRYELPTDDADYEHWRMQSSGRSL
ncbi:uncharacterized protein LOC114721889 [Neltuma alba]|uniref:uncharacterized protein LOC114721889 n=1 Tax=Neltuma alba TaxID=207710 RepID=UPI0010A39625|nr:uncharacterized protein LOC114721889 [Prosopis alba]